MCPYCHRTSQTYTDAHLVVRCVGCFNHLPETPGVTNQALQDLSAPMVVAGHVYPGAEGTW